MGGGPQQLSSAPISGSPVTADQGEMWLFAREAAEIWGAIPCASFCLPGFPGRKSLLGNVQEIGRRSEQEAGSSGFEQLCSCYFVYSNLLCLQTRAILRVAWDLGGRFHARSPGFCGDPFCLRQCRAWACTSSELGPAEARRSSLRPGRSTKCRPGLESRESRRERAPRAAAERRPPAPRSATASKLLPGALQKPGCLFVF